MRFQSPFMLITVQPFFFASCSGRPLLGARITRKHPSYWLGCDMLLICSMT
jgi:hypothetical protein